MIDPAFGWAVLAGISVLVLGGAALDALRDLRRSLDHADSRVGMREFARFRRALRSASRKATAR